MISKWGTFSPFSFLVILLLVLPSNFIVSTIKKFKTVPFFNSKTNPIFYVRTYILNGRLSVTVWCFLITYSKQSWIPDTEYDPSDNSNLFFYVEVHVLNLLFLYDFFIFFHVQYILRFGKVTYLSVLFKFILSES